MASRFFASFAIYALIMICVTSTGLLADSIVVDDNRCLEIVQVNNSNFATSDLSDSAFAGLSIKVSTVNKCDRPIFIKDYEIVYENITNGGEGPMAALINQIGRTWVETEDPIITGSSFSIFLSNHKICDSDASCKLEAVMPSQLRTIEVSLYGYGKPKEWKIGQVYSRTHGPKLIPIDIKITNLYLPNGKEVEAELRDISSVTSGHTIKFKLSSAKPTFPLNVIDKSKYELKVQGYVLMNKRACFKQIIEEFTVESPESYSFTYDFYFMTRGVQLSFDKSISMSDKKGFYLNFKSETYIYTPIYISYYNQVVRIPDIEEPIKVEKRDEKTNLEYPVFLKLKEEFITKDTKILHMVLQSPSVSIAPDIDLFAQSIIYYKKANTLIGLRVTDQLQVTYTKGAKTNLLVGTVKYNYTVGKENLEELRKVNSNVKVLVEKTYRTGILTIDNGLVSLINDLNLDGVILQLERPDCYYQDYNFYCPEDIPIVSLVKMYRESLPNKLISIEIADSSLYITDYYNPLNAVSDSGDNRNRGTIINPLSSLVEVIDKIFISTQSNRLQATHKKVREFFNFKKEVFYVFTGPAYELPHHEEVLSLYIPSSMANYSDSLLFYTD